MNPARFEDEGQQRTYENATLELMAAGDDEIIANLSSEEFDRAALLLLEVYGNTAETKAIVIAWADLWAAARHA